MAHSAEEVIERFNDRGCEFGKLTKHDVDRNACEINKHQANFDEMQKTNQKLYVVLIVVTFFSGASAMGYILDMLKMLVGR